MSSRPLIFAGQAGAGYYPQNSLQAAAFSTALGVDGIEISVQWTADQQLVCHQHQRLDPAMTRAPDGRWLTPGEQWPISQLSYAELAGFQLGELNPERPELSKPLRQLAQSHTIPLLSAMLSQLASSQNSETLQLLIHLPAALHENAVEPAFVRALLNEVADYRSSLSIIFTSYDWRLLAEIARQDPGQPCWHRLHPPAWYQPESTAACGAEPVVCDQEQHALLVQQGWQQRKLPWLAGLNPEDYQDLIAQAKARGWRLYCHHSALAYLSDASDVALWTEQQHEPEIRQRLESTPAYALISDSPFSYSHQLTEQCEILAAFGKTCFEKKKWQAVIDRYLPIVQSTKARCHFELVYRLAIALRREQRFHESEQVLLLGLQAYPNHHNLYIELAALENLRERWSQALDYWDKAFHIAESFSVMSYQRLTKAIILSTEQRPWFAKAFYKASSTAHSNPYFSAYFSYFLVTHQVPDEALGQAIDKLLAMQASNFLYQYGVPHLYQMQQLRLRQALLQNPALPQQPAAWNELLKTDKPTRLMPQDIASLTVVLQQLSDAKAQPFYQAVLQAIEPLQGMAKRALVNLCTIDACQMPEVIAAIDALLPATAGTLQAHWLPEQGWLILSNILLLRFQIAAAYRLRQLALACHQQEKQQQGLAALVLESASPISALPAGSDRRQQQQHALAQMLRGQPDPFRQSFAYLRDPAFAAAIAGKRIALVGPVNVGELQGEQIDQHDLVIRLNYRSPAYWDPAQAGSRTDISYYANDLIKGEDTDAALVQGMQQLQWVVFDTQTSLPAGVKLARARCQLPYRDCNPVYKGYVNAIQKVILDLLLHQPAGITVFNTNLWLADSTIAGYHTGHPRNQVSRFIWHDPASNFRFLQCCWQHGYIQADPVLSRILQQTESDYIQRLDAVIQAQEAS